jgi:hypothetical protein
MASGVVGWNKWLGVAGPDQGRTRASSASRLFTFASDKPRYIVLFKDIVLELNGPVI